MERYNQGFYKFGPMEQVKDGQWIKYQDHRDKVDWLKTMYKNLLEDTRKSEDILYKENCTLTEQFSLSSRALKFSMVANILLLIHPILKLLENIK